MALRVQGLVTRALLSAAALGAVSTVAASAALAGDDGADDVRVRLVAELPRNEPYEGHLFHDGFLFVTRTRQADGERHHVDVYDASGSTRVATVDLDHTAGFIYPYSAHQVFVVGKSATPYWKTHYTVITRNGTQFTTRTTTLPEQYQVEMAGGSGSPDGLFFTEPGDRAILRGTRSGGLTSLGFEISGPGALQVDGSTLWAVERRGFELGDEGLSRIDTRTGAMTRVFDNYRAGLFDLAVLPSYPWVATSELLTGKVLFVNKATNALEHEVEVGGQPTGMTQLDACLVVTSEDTKTLSFIGLWGEEGPHMIAQWDVSGAGDMLKKPRRISADPATGRVFIRSSYPCPTCASTQSSVFVAEEADGETFEKCRQNLQ
jgi:hypothetical protein